MIRCLAALLLALGVLVPPGLDGGPTISYDWPLAVDGQQTLRITALHTDRLTGTRPLPNMWAIFDTHYADGQRIAYKLMLTDEQGEAKVALPAKADSRIGMGLWYPATCDMLPPAAPPERNADGMHWTIYLTGKCSTIKDLRGLLLIPVDPGWARKR